MNLPENLKYAHSHEWIRLESDGSVTVGITDHAQDTLGDLVFIELPAVGASFAANQEAAVVESVKTAADVHAPVAGTVTAVNTDVADAPESVNQDAYAAWLFKLNPTNPADLSTLLEASQYKASVDAS